MEAVIFIVRTLLQVLLVTVFLLRVLLPIVRANPGNQLTQAVIRLTNPLVMPLRRILPPIGKADTASIVALLLVETAATATLWLIGAYPGLTSRGDFVSVVLLNLASAFLQFYIFCMFMYVLLSWVAPGTYSPAAAILHGVCDPLLRPVRRVIPPIAQIDMSAMFVMIGLIALNIWVGMLMRPYVYPFL
jgi:YggT family protein